jgi:hypothetical protein
MIEGVVAAIQDSSEGKGRALMLCPLLVECWQEKPIIFSCVCRRLTVFPRKAVQTFPFFFFLKLSVCSNTCESSYFTFDAPIFFWQWAFIWPFSLFSHPFSISAIDLRWGNLLFIPVHVWQMYEHVIYMMNSPFERWHMVVTLVWWNKNFYSCSNSIIEIS